MQKILIILIFTISVNIFSQDKDITFKDIYLESYSFMNPVAGSNFDIIFSDYFGYGYKKSIYQENLEKRNSIRIECENGTKVFSMTDCTFLKTERGSWGNTLVVEFKEYTIFYDGIKILTPYKLNQKIKRGENVGITNVSASEPGPALLIRIKYKGIYIDPMLMINFKNNG